MLKKRLIPKLLIKELEINNEYFYTVVNSTNFSNYRNIGDPLSQAKIFQSQLADELVLLHIDKVRHKKTFLNFLAKLSTEIFMPITVGGGVSSVSYVRELIRNGADKVSINSFTFKNKKIINETSRIFGSQCVVGSIDYKFDPKTKKRFVYSDGGKKNTNKDVLEWAKTIESEGAGEILLTSIDSDGSLNGLDIEFIEHVASSISIPVIASGGCGKTQHFIDAFKKTNINAICAGNFFNLQDQNILQTRANIFNNNIAIRTNT